ncbi:CYTH domain-containing protein [Treponema sp. C6A8]|uniref:CYTH domain-containing protein n=1 Tax=Treponema sp. C6A8 TaxID=1410609 RepID=UPI000AFDFFE9|nr:CYTH domain-containing protein [Treponema sp. C6A8]
MNYEIELKAHVKNREEVIEKLNKAAAYLGHTEKEDDYYHFELLQGKVAPDGRDFISARIRKETLTLNGEKSSTCYMTYKRKEIKKNEDGTEIEVNEENEITFENAAPLEILFSDLGGKIDLHKSKSVEQWSLCKNGEKAHVELCEVPPLGDFLEIEIIKNQNDEETVKKCKKFIEEIFADCGISKEMIEPRYYRDMLKSL